MFAIEHPSLVGPTYSKHIAQDNFCQKIEELLTSNTVHILQQIGLCINDIQYCSTDKQKELLQNATFHVYQHNIDLKPLLKQQLHVMKNQIKPMLDSYDDLEHELDEIIQTFERFIQMMEMSLMSMELGKAQSNYENLFHLTASEITSKTHKHHKIEKVQKEEDVYKTESIFMPKSSEVKPVKLEPDVVLLDLLMQSENVTQQQMALTLIKQIVDIHHQDLSELQTILTKNLITDIHNLSNATEEHITTNSFIAAKISPIIVLYIVSVSAVNAVNLSVSSYQQLIKNVIGTAQMYVNRLSSLLAWLNAVLQKILFKYNKNQNDNADNPLIRQDTDWGSSDWRHQIYMNVIDGVSLYDDNTAKTNKNNLPPGILPANGNDVLVSLTTIRDFLKTYSSRYEIVAYTKSATSNNDKKWGGNYDLLEPIVKNVTGISTATKLNNSNSSNLNSEINRAAQQVQSMEQSVVEFLSKLKSMIATFERSIIWNR